MINLLPPDVKEEYRYGLRNSWLLKWVSAFVLAIAGLGIIATYGLLTLQHSSDTYNNQIKTAQDSLKKQNLVGTEAQVKDTTTNLKLVVQVLSKEVLFSKLLTQIAAVIPSNVVLKDLNINQTTGGIDIRAGAINYQAATQIQINLEDPANKLFSKADIVSIACQKQPENPKYPCNVQIRALFANNNPYLFINSKAGS